MRLSVLDKPRSWFARLELWILRLLGGPGLMDPAKVMLYRAEWGRPYSRMLHESLRGRSSWSIGERELFAAFTSKLNTCSYCVGAHGAVATKKLGDRALEMALTDWRTAPVRPNLRAMLGFLEKMTLAPADLGPEDAAALRASGVSDQAAREAIRVCWVFNVGNRQAEAFGFAKVPPEQLDRVSRFILLLGYRI
jgi:uncharacterized peroxidase-related enzyme